MFNVLKSEVIFFLTLVTISIDQALRFYFLHYQPEIVVRNPQLAFSQGSALFILPALLVLLGIGFSYRFQPRLIWFSLFFAIGSNLFDRLTSGGIVDYIPLGSLSLNLADILIVFLVGLLIVTKKPA